MKFVPTLRHHFPDAVPTADFVRATHVALGELGFDAPNTIACVGGCRDEIARSLGLEVYRTWGEAFNFASLAGMLTLGRTGFAAARQHAPTSGGKERFVFLAMPHIGINGTGEIGLVRRRGQPEDTTACGALVAFRDRLVAGHASTSIDPDDVEQSLLEMRLQRCLAPDDPPSLLELTRIAARAVTEDLERLIAGADMHAADYAVLTGILINGPDGDWVWPRTLYATIDGTRRAVPGHESAPDES